jgi:hypothetical protein
MRTIESLTEEFENIIFIKVFEIEVERKSDLTKDHVLFHISIEDDRLIAQHEALNKEQEESDKIPHVVSDINPTFSLDENLQCLYDECMDAIFDSEYFSLR